MKLGTLSALSSPSQFWRLGGWEGRTQLETVFFFPNKMTYGKVLNFVCKGKNITSWLNTEALEISWIHNPSFAIYYCVILNKLLNFSELFPISKIGIIL